MGLLIRLGLKNIGRNRIRSMLTIGAVALCAGGIVLFNVFINGSMKIMLEGMTTQDGHIKYIHPELAKNKRLGQGFYFVRDVTKFSKAVKEVDGVVSVVPRIETGGFLEHSFTLAQEKVAMAAKKCTHKTLINPDEKASGMKAGTYSKQTPAPGLGLLPSAERPTWDIHKKIVAGRMLKDTGKEMIIGYLLATRLHACVGSQITVIGKTVDDSLSALNLKVVGIFNMGGSSQDKSFMINLKTAQYYMDLTDGASAVLVYTKDKWQSRKIAAAIKAKNIPAKVVGEVWQDTPLTKMTLPLINIIMYFLSGLVIFIGGVGLLNTMMMSVMERRKEIGIMMALGVTPGKIRNIFVFEGVVFGVFGAVLGVGLGLLASIPLVTKGIEYGSDVTSKMSFPMASTFKGEITLEGILFGLLVGILTTFVGSILPAMRAAKLEPVEVLRQS